MRSRPRNEPPLSLLSLTRKATLAMSSRVCRSTPAVRGWPIVLLAASLPARAGEVSPVATAVASEAEAAPECPLLSLPWSEVTTVPTPEALARLEGIASANVAEIERLDARWRAGEFGPPRSPEADDTVRRLARLRLKNWYSFVLSFSDNEEVRALEAKTIEEISARYCDSTVFPTPRLRAVLAGRGWVCAQYDLPDVEEEGATVLGGRHTRYSVRKARVEGRERRVLAVEWRSASVGQVEILFADHYGFRLQRRRVVDEGMPYDVFLALDVFGAWVHRFGVHRPAAFAFWAARPGEGAGEAFEFRVGSAVYVPRLRVRLPLLPDVGLNDLRVLDPPVPLLRVADLLGRALPEWLPTGDDTDLADWTRIGGPPAAVRDLFPDL
jgi:hypothetical protein